MKPVTCGLVPGSSSGEYLALVPVVAASKA
jgi:hypothetical protein